MSGVLACRGLGQGAFVGGLGRDIFASGSRPGGVACIDLGLQWQGSWILGVYGSGFGLECFWPEGVGLKWSWLVVLAKGSVGQLAGTGSNRLF